MPIFEYRCPDCVQDFEILVRGSDAAACPVCGSLQVEKLLSAAAAPGTGGRSALPIASACPPPEAGPCGPMCCRLP